MPIAKKDAPKTYPPLLPGALRGGVAIWILLFRDHLKKASRMLAEARATLASVAFLRSYDSDVIRAGQSEGKTSPSGDLSHDSDVVRAGQSEGQTPPSDDLSHNSNALRAGQSEGQTPLFDDLHTVVAQHISTIGELQEAIRDDLIVLQSLFTERPVFDKRALTVDGPSPTKGNTRVFLRSRPSDQPTVGERYEVALWVLFDDTPRNAIKSLYNVARQRADMQSTGATSKLKAVMDWLRRQEDEDSAQRRARARGAEPSRLDRTLRGQFAGERAKLLRLVLDLQGQPYCQPARVRHWREKAPHTSDWQELDKVLCALVDITIEDGRMGRLLERVCQMAAEGSRELVKTIPKIFQRELRVEGVVDVAKRWHNELTTRGMGGTAIPASIAEDVRDLLFSPTVEDDETVLLDFVLQRISSPAGEALRKEIVELVIDIADECWLRRASGVLQARSELITRGSAAMNAGYLDPIHSSFFAKAARRHQEFEDQLASLRQIVQAAEERSNLIHPGFPAVPRYHLRDREQVERVMLEMIKNFKDQVQSAASLVLDPHLLPKLTIEVSFDLCFGSEIRFVGYMSRVFGVILVVPFNVLRAPRLLGALAHELAHALISNAMIEDLLHGDRPSTMAGWTSPAGGVLTYAGAELAKTYRDYGIEVATPASIIAESLADFMALLTVGPSYVYTLFFSTVGLSAIPSDPTRVAVSTEINPMVRVGVLLRLVDKLWPKQSDVEAAAAPKATPGAWKIEWLRPVREAWESYFRMFDQAGYEGDIRELRRRDCFLSEVKIIGSAFCLIVELTKHRAPPGIHDGEPESQSPSKLESWSDFVVPSGQAAEVAALFDEIGASGRIPRRKRALEGNQHSEPAPYSVVAKSAAVHLLWCKHLAEFDRALNLVDEASANAESAPSKFDMSLHAAIWTRPSEVRGLLQFLEAAGREGEGSAQRMTDSGAVSGPHEETVHQGGVGEPLSLAQIDCMWTSATDVELGALKTDLDEDTYAVIGPYDFLRVRRAFGAEDLSRRRNAPADDLPVRPSVRTQEC